jgi:small subunit ribosomal protein S16
VLKIRLRRVGAKKQPSYRIVVAESTSPRDGRFVEVVGHYNPRTEPETVEVKSDRAAYWLSHGAQPSPAVERLLKKQGVYDALAQLRNPAAVAATPAPEAAAPLVSEASETEASVVEEYDSDTDTSASEG